MSGLSFADLAGRLAAAVPGCAAQHSENRQPSILVGAEALVTACRRLRDDPELAFDSLMDLTGWDLLKFAPPPAPPKPAAKPAAAGAEAKPAPAAAPSLPAAPPSDDIVVVYYLHSLRHRHHLTLKVLAPRAACTVPSVAAVWPVANYFEREVYDLLGVVFAGHPDLRRIMCPDDWVGHPLRKDYVYPADYHGIAHLRAGQRFEDGPARAAELKPQASGLAPGGAP